jgi:hypothetical protein
MLRIKRKPIGQRFLRYVTLNKENVMKQKPTGQRLRMYVTHENETL